MKVNFMDAMKAMSEYKKVSCVVGEGTPVIYQAIDEVWTVNGKEFHFRDFCFSPTQVLFGEWTIELE